MTEQGSERAEIENRKSKIENHFIDIRAHGPSWLRRVLETAERLRGARDRGETVEPLAGRTLALVFEKPSLRTRVSFEQAMVELGGRAIYLDQREVGLGTREPTADVARVLAGMVDGVAARVFEHGKLHELAAHCATVVNALSDHSHPCQALADVLTLRDAFGPETAGRKIAYIGDGNNVALSLAELCGKLGLRFAIAAPPGYQLDPAELDAIRTQCPDADLEATDEPRRAVEDADAVYTDTFVSMGQEEEKANRLRAFEGFQVNADLLAHAPDRAIVLHCLPAYRGVEITADVIDGPQSRVFEQAHNRLHAQKGLLAELFKTTADAAW